MEIVDIVNVNWLEEGITECVNFAQFGNQIQNCIPPIFESYCKIFHPFQEVLNLFNGDFESVDWKYNNWKSIAATYDLEFHNEINPMSFHNETILKKWNPKLYYPLEGALPRHLFIYLLPLLEKNSPLYIYQKSPHSIYKNDDPEELIKCNFDEILNYFDNQSDFKGYLYDEKKTWIIFSDNDLAFTIVGGTKNLIDAILSSDLEALECVKETRVDYFSDKIN